MIQFFLVALLLCGGIPCPTHANTGIDQSEYAKSNPNGQSCGSSEILECEMLADLDKIVSLLNQILIVELSNSNELKTIEHKMH